MDEINKLIKDFIRDGHYNKSDEYHKEFKLYAVDSAGYDVDDSVELSIKDNKIVLTFFKREYINNKYINIFIKAFELVPKND